MLTIIARSVETRLLDKGRGSDIAYAPAVAMFVVLAIVVIAFVFATQANHGGAAVVDAPFLPLFGS